MPVKIRATRRAVLGASLAASFANERDGNDKIVLPGSDHPYKPTRGGEEDAARKGDLDLADENAPGEHRAANVYFELTTRLENTIIGADLGGAESCDAPLDSVGHNLDQGTTCGLDQAAFERDPLPAAP